MLRPAPSTPASSATATAGAHGAGGATSPLSADDSVSHTEKMCLTKCFALKAAYYCLLFLKD